MLKISATNLEISISQLVRCKVETEGVVCLPARLLTEIVSNLPNDPITIESGVDGLKLSVGKYKTAIKTVLAEDFPVLSDNLPDKLVKFESAALKKALEGVLFAVSSNETQAELCGVNFNLEQEKLTLAGTDRYRLAESVVALPQPLSVGGWSAIIPARAVSEVVKAVTNNDGVVEMGVGDNQAVFVVGETIITTRLVEGQYPEYGAIIPKDFSTTITLGRTQFLAALRAVSVFARGVSGVEFVYGAAAVTLSAKSQDAGEGVVEVQAAVTGTSDTVLFNHKYLLDVLQYLTAESVEIKLNNPGSPVIFKGMDEPGYTYLVMPIKS
jgi:DNA polymerase-3 subunit beta